MHLYGIHVKTNGLKVVRLILCIGKMKLCTLSQMQTFTQYSSACHITTAVNS